MHVTCSDIATCSKLYLPHLMQLDPQVDKEIGHVAEKRDEN